MFSCLATHRENHLSRSRNAKRRGTVAIEFALLVPLMLIFIAGTIEMSLLFLTQHVLENAVYNASRTSKTGYVATSSTQLQTVQAALEQRLNGLAPLMDTSQITVTTTSYANLTDLITATGATAASLGGSAEIMVYTVSYPWHFFTPLIADAMGHPSGTMTLEARIVVRNEPY